MIAVEKQPKLTVLGWHEALSLPELGIETVYAKLDTGADHSALHAHTVRVLPNAQVEFTLPLLLVQHSCADFPLGGPRRVCARLADERIVRSSNGEEEVRYVIETRMEIAHLSLTVWLSLTDRSQMQFPLLLGRSALAQGILVDSSRAHLASAATKACAQR